MSKSKILCVRFSTGETRNSLIRRKYPSDSRSQTEPDEKGVISVNGNIKLLSAKIIIYEGTIKETTKNPKTEDFGLTIEESIAATMVHESVHATDKLEIQKQYSKTPGFDVEEKPRLLQKRFIDEIRLKKDEK